LTFTLAPTLMTRWLAHAQVPRDTALTPAGPLLALIEFFWRKPFGGHRCPAEEEEDPPPRKTGRSPFVRAAGPFRGGGGILLLLVRAVDPRGDPYTREFLW